MRIKIVVRIPLIIVNTDNLEAARTYSIVLDTSFIDGTELISFVPISFILIPIANSAIIPLNPINNKLYVSVV